MSGKLWLLLWLIGANIVSFALFGVDKRRAKKQKWRIRERTLFLWAALGGSIGALLGMACFRHKTQHRRFVCGIPAIFAAQMLLLWFFTRA